MQKITKQDLDAVSFRVLGWWFQAHVSFFKDHNYKAAPGHMVLLLAMIIKLGLPFTGSKVYRKLTIIPAENGNYLLPGPHIIHEWSQIVQNIFSARQSLWCFKMFKSNLFKVCPCHWNCVLNCNDTVLIQEPVPYNEPM